MKLLRIATLPLLLACCKSNPVPTIAPGQDKPDFGTYQVQIDPTKTYQTMESFAASDCWDPNYVGQYWASSEKEKMAQLLFSQNISNGQPEGIGLSGWRFNLGAGSAQQGDASGISDISRRADSFLNIKDGKTYDWSQHAGQQFFLQKAKEYGVKQFVMFSNSPLVNYTLNGKAFSSQGAFANLKPEHYRSFAEYITTVLEHFKTQKGIEFDFISPVNEPQHDWKEGSQEGSAWQNAEVAKITRELNQSLQAKKLNTKIMLSEAAHWNDLYEEAGDSGRKDVIKNLFQPSSANYIGNLPSVAPLIAGHSYWTDGSWNELIQVRSNVFKAAQAAGLKVYQSEWSMLGDGYDTTEFVGYDKASYMDIALYMSKVIHTDIVYANASSWSYWTSMATERWGHKNRFYLIRLKPTGGDFGDIRQGGTHEASKTLWVLGNYSRFIRPNYKRVDLQLSGASKLKFGTAYISPDGKTLVAVYTNLSNETFNAKAKVDKVNKIQTYTTNATQDLSENNLSSADASILVQPQSVVTVVYTLQ